MWDQCHLPTAHVNAQCEVTFQTKYCLPPGAAKILEEIATEIGGFDVKVWLIFLLELEWGTVAHCQLSGPG